MEEIKWMVKELDKKDLYSEDMTVGYKFWKLIHTDDGGYTENEIRLYVFENGAISFSGDNDGAHIYFYPEQAEQLKTIFKNH